MAGLKRFATIFTAFLFLSTGINAAEDLPRMQPGGTSTVKEVIDGDTVALDPPVDGADQVRLVGIQAPKLALGRKGFEEWPMAPGAKAALERLVLGQPVELRFGGAKMDRHGRHLAHLFTEDGTWVQGEMLSRGWARVYTFPDNEALAAEMYAAEDSARADRRGIWGHRYYRVRSSKAGPLYNDVGTFQIVAGTVAAATNVRGRVYLNFGEDWKTDFTITLDSKVRKRFEKAGLDPLTLEGRSIEVRGWLRKRNGPMISATHRQQARVLVGH